MTFVDTNVLIDVFGQDANWEDWSRSQLEASAMAGDVLVNPIVVAELSSGYRALSDLLDLFEAASIRVVPLDEDAAFLAGTVFARYRRERTALTATKVLPDFLIGAHAALLGVPLLTRDATIYRRYFPELMLITPENENG